VDASLGVTGICWSREDSTKVIAAISSQNPTSTLYHHDHLPG